jgi:FkbM family methyltransferase
MSKRLKKMIRLLGMFDGLYFYWRAKTKKFGKIRASKWGSSFFLRPKTTDFSTYQHVFESNQYAIKLDFEPKVVIDGGANIGLSSIFFARSFPNAAIVAIEPNAENFSLLKSNTAVFNNIHCRQQAIWSKSGFVKIIDDTADKNSFQVSWTPEKIKNSIDATSLGELKKSMGLTTLDIVKLDIEGAEKEVFSQHTEEWLPYTRVLIIEMHDHLIPGCSQSVFTAITKYDFRCEISWENLVFHNQAIKS